MPATDYSALREEVTTGKTAPVTDTRSAGSATAPETPQPDIKFGVGMSQEWDPYKARVQVPTLQIIY
ncbi:MAG: hypothetical protein L6243_04290 [Candidatus Altiarchaeales archaeon]|nr:hypothetical protein [Candidatus Altiarchaeota archaeon]MBU4406409.1 hypothetical protein [Candidatus Altiarchaeota archaeon]MBU4437919.1 hypothetical protein [Candidatus Altiarchaeota archaeon]MCG2782788.1 hypothetical protein [Candidatus Altiarchaeales archaeon]